MLVVTPHGDECSEEEGEHMRCTKRWNDFEVDGPRCRNTAVSGASSHYLYHNLLNPGQGDLQWCATCHTDNPNTAAEDCATYKVRQETDLQSFSFNLYPAWNCGRWRLWSLAES